MAKYFEVNENGMEYRLAVRDALGRPSWLCDENGNPVDLRPEILACRGQADMDALTGRIMRAVEKREGPVRQFVIAQHHKPRQEGPQAAPGHKDPPWYFDHTAHRDSWFDKNWRERARYGDRSKNDGKYRFEIKFPKDAKHYTGTAAQDAAQRQSGFSDYVNVNLGEPYDPEKHKPSAAEEGTRMHKAFQDRIDELVEEQLNVNYADVEARIMAAFGLGEDALKDVRSAYAGVKARAEEFNEVLRDIGKTIKSPKQRSHPVSPRKGRHNQQIPNPKWKRK